MTEAERLLLEVEERLQRMTEDQKKKVLEALGHPSSANG